MYFCLLLLLLFYCLLLHGFCVFCSSVCLVLFCKLLHSKHIYITHHNNLTYKFKYAHKLNHDTHPSQIIHSPSHTLTIHTSLTTQLLTFYFLVHKTKQIQNYTKYKHSLSHIITCSSKYAITDLLYKTETTFKTTSLFRIHILNG